MNKINSKYRKIIERINAEGEKYTNEQMKEVYREQSKARDEVQKLIGTLFIKFSVDGFLKLTKANKDKLMHEISQKLKGIGKNLGTKEIDKVASILEDIYADTYYKNAYVMEIGTTKDLKFDLLNDEIVKKAINKKIDGMLFSDRIWQNKADLIDKLKQSISECMDGKTTIDKIGRDISKIFNVSAYQSNRLVITELTRIQGKAQEDIAKSTGIKKQMWSATLDTHTCERCAALDGKIFDIDDLNKPQMPLHPLDRCCWINVPDEDWKPDKRIDNLTKEEIDWKDYKEWYQEKLRNNSKILIEKKKVENKSKDKKQFERYKEVLGKDFTIKSFDEFQELKYNSSKEWEKLKIDYLKQNRFNKIVEESSKLNIKGEVIKEINRIDISEYKFDEFHINLERKHNITKEKAQDYINNAEIAYSRWKGEVIVYISKAGCCVVNLKNKIVSTAYSSAEYDDKFKRILEVIEND